jgi:hypothetical protein
MHGSLDSARNKKKRRRKKTEKKPMSSLPIVPLVLSVATFQRHFNKTGAGVEPDSAVGAAVDAAAAGRFLAEQARDTYGKIIADEASGPLVVRQLKAKRIVGPLLEKVAKHLDAATEKVTAEINKLAASTGAPVLSGDPTKLAQASELRAVLRESTQEKRGELLNKALDAGDDSMWSAVLHGHHALTGMEKSEFEARRDVWRKRRHPQEHARIARLRACERDLRVAADSVVDFASKLFAQGARHEGAAALAEAAIAKAAEATR